ncbi:hypothetical protein ACSNOC_27350, partial [Streptomyces sp. URMC 129]
MSYASSTGDRGQVQRFHSDIQHEVNSRLGGVPRFEGRLQPAGPPAAGPHAAVLDCRTLVALYSEDYVNSPDCARDWAVFRERMDRRTRRTGQRPPTMIGVLWRTPRLVLPRAIADAEPLIGDGDGVAGLLREQATGWDRYRDVVRLVADRVIAGAEISLPPMTAEDARDVRPRFGPGTARPTAAPTTDAAPAAPPDSGRERTTVLLLAGTRERMAPLRATRAPPLMDWLLRARPMTTVSGS